MRFFLAAAIAFASACDEPDVPASPPIHEAAEPAPDPTPPVESVSPRLDPPRYVERNLDLPDVLECPGSDVCVTEYDSVVWVLKGDWQHHYRLDYGSPTTAIRAGGVPPSVWRARVAAGVAHVFEEERTVTALGHCSLASWMPELYQVDDEGIEVSVPAAENALSAPGPVTPITANTHLRDEYAFINLERARSVEWFSREESARMRADSFEHPQLRQVSAYRIADGVYRELNLSIVFSAESRHVYVLERSFEMPEEERRGQLAQRKEDNARAMLDFLQSLRLSSVHFDASAACDIPEALGGSEWMPLSGRP